MLQLQIYSQTQPKKLLRQCLATYLIQHYNKRSPRRDAFFPPNVICILAVLHKGVNSQIYNIGTEFEISIMDLAKKLIAELGLTPPEKYLEFVEDRHINDTRYAIDIKKLKVLLRH